MNKITDPNKIFEAVVTTLEKHKRRVADYLAGNHKIRNYLFMQATLELKGRAEPDLLGECLDIALNYARRAHENIDMDELEEQVLVEMLAETSEEELTAHVEESLKEMFGEELYNYVKAHERANENPVD